MTDTKHTHKRFDWSIVFNKYLWLVIFLVTYGISWFRLPPVVPLFYSQSLPEDRLASKYALLVLPVIVFVSFFVNERILSRLALKHAGILSLIKYASVTIAIFTYVLFLKIILLVI